MSLVCQRRHVCDSSIVLDCGVLQQKDILDVLLWNLIMIQNYIIGNILLLYIYKSPTTIFLKYFKQNFLCFYGFVFFFFSFMEERGVSKDPQKINYYQYTHIYAMNILIYDLFNIYFNIIPRLIFALGLKVSRKYHNLEIMI